MVPTVAPNYDALDRLLSGVELAPSPAEAQAMLCGLLATQVADPVRRWRAQLLEPTRALDEGDASAAPDGPRDITFLAPGDRAVHEHGPNCEHGPAASQAVDIGAEAGGRDDALDALVRWTEAAISPPSVAFDLLLPSDDRPLLERATAVHDWVRGLLFGLTLGGLERDQLDGEAREAFDDLVELTRMDLAAIEDTDEDEQALVEVIEFLRIAAMSIREAMPRSSPVFRAGLNQTGFH